MENDNLKEFWELYDQYILKGEKEFRPKLSHLLSTVEIKDRRNQLLRSEKGWTSILAWQVLRTQEFYFHGNTTFALEEGEILAWTPHWDRDVFLTRMPYNETVSGRFIKPGFNLTSEDKQGTDYEWEATIRRLGITDERGLYLPIYDPVTLMKFCDQEIAKMRPRIIEYLGKEKSISEDVLKKL